MQRLHFTCTVEGCDRQHKARGYCQTHYMQFKRGAPVTEAIRSRVSVKPDVCVEEGCHESVKAKGLCKAHYQRLLRHGHTKYRDRKKPPKSCSAPGCTDILYSNGKCAKHYARGKRMQGYGITQEQHDTLFAQSGGMCWICEGPETSRDGSSGKVRALAVDHCHGSGAVRGLLCRRCNQAIGMFRDDTDLLGKAIQYLLKPPPFPPS